MKHVFTGGRVGKSRRREYQLDIRREIAGAGGRDISASKRLKCIDLSCFDATDSSIDDLARMASLAKIRLGERIRGDGRKSLFQARCECESVRTAVTMNSRDILWLWAWSV